MMWKLKFWLACHFNVYRYTGRYDPKHRDIPMAYVRYRDGSYSIELPVGDAVDIARFIHGEVVSPEEFEAEMALKDLVEKYPH